MEDLELKIEERELWIEDVQSRLEDSIVTHQHSIHILLVILCRKSCYFEDIVNH